MTNRGTFYRLVILGVMLATGFVALGYRLVELQINRHEELRLLSQKQTRHTIYRESMRGQIKDCRGNPLAMSVPVKTVCADPTLIGSHQLQVARVLAPLLQTNEHYLVERLSPRTREVDGRMVTNQYIVLKRKVPLETWEKVSLAMSNLTFGIDEKALRQSQKLFYRNLRRNAIFQEEDQMRVYPNGRLASHVIGFVGGDDDDGQNGIELSFNQKLTGVRGWRRTESAKGRELVAYRDQNVEPRDGMNVVLTIDSGVQNIVETELAEAMARHTPISVSCIVIRPRTGEVVAMATLPDYDPNRAGNSPSEALRNRVICDIAEPGSTFKIVVVSAALHQSALKLSDVFFCENGRFPYAGRILHDHESHGNLTVEQIITKSSNIGAAKIGIRLGEEALYSYIKQFGFGTETGLPLPGEVNGIVHPPTKWSKVSIAQIPMGHGLASTPVQTAFAMAAIANGGRLMRPMLVSRVEDTQGKVVGTVEPQMVRQVINENAARQTVKALKTVISEEGTASKARLENYTVAGKTGTAQKVENGRYVHGKYFSSFIGFFPADDPELCISVVMDEPKNGHYGGQTAAPVFHNIAERAARYLNIRPDIQTKDTFAAVAPAKR